MKRSRRISISAAVTTGLVGLGAAAVAGVPVLSFASAATTTEHSDTDHDSQAAQDRQELEDALDAMRTNTGALDDDLSEAKQELRVAEQAAAARAAAARAAAALRAQQKSAAATAKQRSEDDSSVGTSHHSPPGTHATTGASGSGDGDDDGGSDDGGSGGGSDDGGGGGDD